MYTTKYGSSVWPLPHYSKPRYSCDGKGVTANPVLCCNCQQVDARCDRAYLSVGPTDTKWLRPETLSNTHASPPNRTDDGGAALGVG